jgi:hypothetical protein
MSKFFRLNVVMLSVVMMNVVAAEEKLNIFIHNEN